MIYCFKTQIMGLPDEIESEAEPEETRVESCNMIQLEDEDDEDISLETFLYGKPNKECFVTLRSGTSLPERRAAKQTETAQKTRDGQVTENQPARKKSGLTVGDYNVLAHLRKIPALVSIYDTLMLSAEMRDALIYALQNPE